MNAMQHVLSVHEATITHNQKQINLKFEVLQDLPEEERVKSLRSIEEGLDPVIAEFVTDYRGENTNTTLSKK